jgi:prepilin-type N-terminal cleavage/methylation domain-containing protein
MNMKKRKGFSLIEVILGIALLAVAMLGLAQLFLMGLYNNARADQVSNATFLAQQRMDEYRILTAEELTALGASPADEMVDVNNDGADDFRRVSRLTPEGLNWLAEVWVFPAGQRDAEVADLVQDPDGHRCRAEISSVIVR